MDLWNVARFMSQLPSDYLNNRASLPSQQAIVSSARNYLEYSYVLLVNFIFIQISISILLDFAFSYQNFLLILYQMKIFINQVQYIN